MQNIICKVLISLSTFIIGVGLATARLYIRNKPISLCALSANPIRYDGNIVRVYGEIYVSPNGIIQLNGSECGLRSKAWADVSFKENPKLIEELKLLNKDDNGGKAEVVLTGKFTDLQHSCFSPQFEISGANLERTSGISIINFPEEVRKEDARQGN